MQDRPLITLTTDFGYEDAFVGVMKGVILKINPRAAIVDLTHGIRPYSIVDAAYAIGTSYSYFPEKTIHVVVADPGVGSSRRALIAEAANQFFVGPDNGVLSYIFRNNPGEVRVFDVTAERYFLSAKSPTFQARDLFCPVAAWLSRGISPAEFGAPIKDYFTPELPAAEITSAGSLKGEIIHIDRFGNAISSIRGSDMAWLREKRPEEGLRVLLKGREIPVKVFYAQCNDSSLSALLNSSGYLEFFIYRGDASAEHHISIGDPVEVAIIA
ncbi:MAG: SAM-dependent chlorinase/fluorinase [Nitrospirae bacterium]|nr:SAM-dependent chlorinase/fluorinase [Nitrospirota bacterium]